MKKRIEEAELAFADREYEVGEIDHDALCKGFFHGAEYALSHQWITVEEALPKNNEDVICLLKDGRMYIMHRFEFSSDEYIWSAIIQESDSICFHKDEVICWMPIPQFETKDND